MTRSKVQQLVCMATLAAIWSLAQATQAQVYYQVDALIWWTKANPLPVLVSTGPAGAMRMQAGVLDQGATPAVGGRGAESSARYGGRTRLGFWLDDNEDDAAEFHWFSLGKAQGYGDYFQGTDGDPILARPFFNVQSGMEDAELVAFPGAVTGQVLVDTSSEMHSAGILCRRNWMRGARGRLDIIGGYRYLRFREALHVQENLVNADPMIIQIGTTIDVMDRFVTENDFNGIEVGFDLIFEAGPLLVDVLAKLAVGNVHQEVTVQGQTVVTTPGDPSVLSQGGLLALSSNIGTRDNDELALLPEITINLSYPLTQNIDIQAGYTLMFLTSVLRTGQQVDRNVNPSLLPMSVGPITGPANPAPIFNDTSIWAQGLNVGINGTF